MRNLPCLFVIAWKDLPPRLAVTRMLGKAGNGPPPACCLTSAPTISDRPYPRCRFCKSSKTMLTATDGTRNGVPLGGIDRYAYYGQPLLWVQDNALTIIVPPGAERLEPVGSPEGPDATCAGGDYWWEIFNGTEIFEACGTWKASVADPARIAGTIDGAFGYYNTQGTTLPQKRTSLFCRAADHQFTLTPRLDARKR